mmetsp:Transcript_21727/g.38222  ORF Transcript_21727/g.38222 Transcript_21727/m.38222 type:complete len:174 (+) Transcript_21727:119-640(+)
MASFGLNNSSQPASNTAAPTNVDSSTPFLAASEGNLSLLQSSLSILNLPPTITDDNGYNLLHAAASYSQLEIVRYLLSHVSGGDDGHNDVKYVHAGDNDGDTALHYAGTADVARLLVEVGKLNPSQVNKQGKTALQTKREELEETMQDEDMEDDDEDLEVLQGVVEYLSSVAP